jgi:hypothetical protein
MSTYAAADVARVDAMLDANDSLTDAQISGLLLLDEALVAEVRASRDAALSQATAALITAADGVAIAAWRHVSKTRVSETTGKVSGGNPGYRTPWVTLPDGRKIMVHVLDAKKK